MKQENLIEEFSKQSDIRIFLLSHPDQEMVRKSCLHFLGDAAQEWFNKTYGDGKGTTNQADRPTN